MGNLQDTLNKINKRISTQVSEERFSKCTICQKEFRLTNLFNSSMDKFKFCSIECKAKDEENERALRRESEKRRREAAVLIIIPKVFHQFRGERKPIIDKSVFCYGLVGSGKSQYIANIAKKYILEGQRVQWFSYPIFVMNVQSMYRNNEKDPFSYVLELAKFEGVLVLDDIGMEKMSDFVRQITYMLINERYQRELITLITSNRTLKAIDELIHPGIASRIAGMCEVLQFSGKDFRVKTS